MEDGNFDVIVIGTGLTESITAAALSKAGFRVAHVDENKYYGGSEASLSLDEFAQWADAEATSSNPKYTSVSCSSETPSQTRQYSICLSPVVILSIGPIISSLVSSGVAKYGGFRLLEHVGVYHPSGTIKNVPGTKEDVFKSKDISLVDKRRLMRFLMFAVGEFEDKKELDGVQDMAFAEFLKTVFSLKDDIHSALVYALEPTLPTLHRIRRYLRSVGRYGPSPFLVGHYGGAGEIAQGFCRAAAVSGGVYILGRRIVSITHTSTDLSSEQQTPSPVPPFSVTLDEFPDTLTSHIIISSANHVPTHLMHLTKQLPSHSSYDTNASSSIARCVAIIDEGINFSPTTLSLDQSTNGEVEDSPPDSEAEVQPKSQTPLDAGILVFPPSSVDGGSTNTAATVLVTGEGTMSTPKGKWILYIALPLPAPVADSLSAQQLLQPYLDATLALSTSPTPSAPSLPSSSPRGTPQEPMYPTPKPLFTAFYIEHPDPAPPSAESLPHAKTYIVPSSLPPASPLPDLPDAAATHAEAVFWEAVEVLRDAGIQPKREQESNSVPNGDEVELDIENFWPPPEIGEESGGEEEW